MIIRPWVFIGAPFLGAIIIGIYYAGSEELVDQYPTAYSLIYGPLSTLIVSLAIAGMISFPGIKGLPVVAIITVTFITAAILISVDIAITNNRVIDSILVTLFGMAFFTEVILGIMYVAKNPFQWELVLMAASVVTFMIRIILWIGGK